MNKLYSVHDHWTDINKKNDVDIESIDGVIAGIKVNGEDYGGGESDLSTAEVTINDTDGAGWLIIGAFILDRDSDSTIYPQIYSDEEESIQLALYKGKSVIAFPNNSAGDVTVSGDAVNDGDNITVTGDCTITFGGVD